MNNSLKTYEFFGITMVKESSEDSFQQVEEREVNVSEMNNTQFMNSTRQQNNTGLSTLPQSLASNVEIQEWRVYKNVISISLGFTLLFSSFNSIANIQSSINKFLGITALWSIYVTFIVSCLFVPSFLINKLQLKWTMTLCMLTYSIYIATQFYPRYYTLIPASCLVGLAAAPLWSSKSSYITEISLKYSSSYDKNKEVVITRMFGIFFSLFHLSNIIGNYIVSAVLSTGTQNHTASFEESANCGAQFCPRDLHNLTSFGSSDIEEQNNDEKVNLLIGILFASSLIAVVLMTVLVDPLLKSQNLEVDNDSNQKSLLVATFRQLRNKKQLLIVPLTFWSGIQKAFISNDFTVAFITCSSGIQVIGYVMLVFGVFDAIFSILIANYFVKFIGRIPVYSIIALLNLSILVFLLFWKPYHSGYLILFTIAALWGICDAVWQTQTNALYGTLFWEEPTAAFSNYNLWKSFGYMMAYLTSGLLCINVKLYILLAVLIVAMICYYSLEKVESSSDLKLNGERISKKN